MSADIACFYLHTRVHGEDFVLKIPGMFRWRYLVCIILIAEADSSENLINECKGTATELTIAGSSPDVRYENYRQLYENCTVVRNNLEIVRLMEANPSYDFSFLETIREVNGYVLIYEMYVDRIRLNGLRVIRGSKTIPMNVDGQPRKISLYVAYNRDKRSDSIGLKELQLTSLVEITNGDVLFEDNQQLCFGETTINWNYTMVNNPEGTVIIKSSGKKRTCDGPCHETCTIGDGRYCWAEGPDMCQAERPCGNCVKGCTDCSCHSECIAGCTGFDESSCVTCKNFIKNDRCVDRCDDGKYNQYKFEWDYLPPTTYMFGNKCVAKCPENMLIQNEACVVKCTAGHMEDKTNNERKCIPCKDGICPKTCSGTEYWLHGNNLAQFKQCRKVNGNLLITNNSFKWHSLGPNIELADLEILKDIEEISGYLVIQAWHQNLRSLSFLRNLRTIGGFEGIGDKLYSLDIRYTHLKSMDFKSLRQIKSGGVVVHTNNALCYADTINWRKILTSKETNQTVVVKLNANSSTCEEEGQTCSELCSDGCWGPGDDNCVSCLHYVMKGRCVANCTTERRFHAFTAEDGTLECGESDDVSVSFG